MFEPIALGLLLAPSVAGLYLALSAVGFFLARHPLTLLILNRHRFVAAKRVGETVRGALHRQRHDIPFSLNVEGGVIWHDLRRTFATELRARQVHEYDIADLLGHNIQAVTGTYARSKPEALEEAMNRLAEPRSNVIEFKRKAS